MVDIYHECVYLDETEKNFEPELSANLTEESNQFIKSYSKFKYYLTEKLLREFL